MEFAILLEFLADMLRDAPYPAFSEDAYVKTMAFKYGSRKLSGLVGYQEYLLEFLGEASS